MSVPDYFQQAYELLTTGLDHRFELDDDYAMDLVINLPKRDLPDRTDVLEAAAKAVVGCIVAEDVAADPDYQRAFTTWYTSKIRKISRRARNIHWERVQELTGYTATVGTAQVRAFPPEPVSQTHPLLNKLQIAGTDLEPGRAASPPEFGVALYVNAGLAMTVGKITAQVGHGSMLALARMDVETAWRWTEANFPLSVEEVDTARFTERATHPGALVVQDGGFTEIAPGSLTVVALPCGWEAHA